MDDMDAGLRRQFEAAGWFEGRSVPIDAALAAYAEEGFQSWPALEDLLREYSGLQFRSSHTGPAPLRLDALAGLGGVYLETVEQYEELAGTTLTPFGDFTLMVVMLGRDGQIYGGADSSFGRLAASVPELVKVVVNHDPPVQLDQEIDN